MLPALAAFVCMVGYYFKGMPQYLNDTYHLTNTLKQETARGLRAAYHELVHDPATK